MNRMIRNIIYALFLLVGGYACRPAPTEADREKLYAQLRRADSCARSKQEEQAIQLYFEWLERSEGKVNTLTRADVYDKIGKLYLYRNLYVDALDMFRRSAGIYRDMGAWKEEAGAWRNIGRTHLMRQRGDSIIQSYQRAIQLAEETGEQELLKGEVCTYQLQNHDFDPWLSVPVQMWRADWSSDWLVSEMTIDKFLQYHREGKLSGKAAEAAERIKETDTVMLILYRFHQ